jgi:hypothetical protein
MIIKTEIYDGKLLHDRFAYEIFRNKVSAYGNIVSFIALNLSLLICFATAL